MSGPFSRLSKLASQILPPSPSIDNSVSSYQHRHNIHSLSPTLFLPRAAAIEPDVFQNSLALATATAMLISFFRPKQYIMLPQITESCDVPIKRLLTEQEGWPIT